METQRLQQPGSQYSQQNTNRTATLRSTLHTSDLVTDHINSFVFFRFILHALGTATLTPVPPPGAAVLAASPQLYISYTCLVTHTHIFFVCVCSHVSQEPRTRRDRPDDSGSEDYKASRVGELRMSTDSDLAPKPLWPSNSSARESSSAQENVKTDR